MLVTGVSVRALAIPVVSKEYMTGLFNLFANLKFWQPFWLMIHVLLLQIKLCLISHKVTVSQEWPPAKNGCQSKMAARQKWL